MIVLAGDIGGTHTRLALFSTEIGLKRYLRDQVFPSREHHSLKEILEAFFKEDGPRPSAAAFVIAGPVVGDEVEITNLEWAAKKSDVRAVVGDIPIGFFNDLAGIGNFIPVIDEENLVCLNPGKSNPTGAKAVLAPGTGLGEGFLTWDGNEYVVQPSEGGHAAFAPETDEQVKLLEFMRGIYKHVSFERVCSGMAVPHLYAFLKSQGDWQEPEWFTQALAKTEDKTPVIVEAAFEPQQFELCERVVALLAEILAGEAGNLALKVLAVGGVYLAGGVAEKILPVLQTNFMDNYATKGRFADFLRDIPVYVITHPQPALHGAARFAFRLVKDAN